MTIELLLRYTGKQTDSRLIPIASRKIFRNYWLPASNRLGLKWIPLFESGLPVIREDISFIISDLKLLKKEIDCNYEFLDPVVSNILKRIDHLIMELQTLYHTQNVDIYIG